MYSSTIIGNDLSRQWCAHALKTLDSPLSEFCVCDMTIFSGLIGQISSRHLAKKYVRQDFGTQQDVGLEALCSRKFQIWLKLPQNRNQSKLTNSVAHSGKAILGSWVQGAYLVPYCLHFTNNPVYVCKRICNNRLSCMICGDETLCFSLISSQKTVERCVTGQAKFCRFRASGNPYGHFFGRFCKWFPKIPKINRFSFGNFCREFGARLGNFVVLRW